MKLRITAVLLSFLILPVAVHASLDDARVDIDAGRYDAALNQLEHTLAADADNAEARYLLAIIRLKMFEYRDAEDVVDELLDDDENNAEAQYLKGIINMGLVNEVSIFRKLGYARGALAAWQKAVELDPGHHDSRYAVFSYLANAPGMADGDMEVAQAMVPDLHARHPGYGHMADALLHGKNKAVDAQEASLKAAIDHFEGRALPHFALARFYSDHGRYNEARAALDVYHSFERNWKDPNPMLVHMLDGNIKAGLGQPKMARASYDTALAAGDDDTFRKLIEDRIKDLNQL